MRPLKQFSLLILLAALACPAAGQSDRVSSAEKQEKSYAATVEELDIVYRYEKDGTGVLTTRTRLRVHTQQGVSQFGQVYVPFRKEFHSVEFHYVRTIKESGKVIEALVNTVMEITAPVAQQAPVFSDLKYKVVPVPNLQPGDLIEYKVSIHVQKAFRPDSFWLTHYPTRSYPVLSETVVLDIPADKLVLLKMDEAINHTVEEREGRLRHHWKTENPEVEDKQSTPSFLFSVTTFKDWTEVGDWYLDLQSPQAEVTPEIRQKALELTKDASGVQEKLHILFQHVAESVRYVSLSFGLGGYRPHAAGEVLRNQYGDCKDKHTLLAALLDAVGIPSYPVLVHSTRDVVPEVPSPGQFDHLITIVPDGENLIWMDSTLSVAPVGYLPRQFRGRSALVLEPRRSRLVEMAEEDAPREFRKATMTGSIDEHGTFDVQLEVVNEGTFEVVWRRVFRTGNREAIDHSLKLDRPYSLWFADIENILYPDSDDFSSPVTYSYSITAKKFFDPLEKSERKSILSPILRTLPWQSQLAVEKEEKEDEEEKDPSDTVSTQKSAKEDERKIDLGGPGEYSESLSFKIHSDFELTVPASMSEKTDFANYVSSYEIVDDELRIQRTLQVTQPRLPRSRLKELQQFTETITANIEQEFTIRYTGALNALDLADDLSGDDLNTHGRSALRNRDYILARDLFLKATEKVREHKWAWNNLGLAYIRLGKYFKAEDAFRKQIEINSRDEYAFNNLGQVLVFQGRVEEAIEAFQKQLEITPDDKRTPPNLASALFRLERWNEAEAAFKLAAERAPENPRHFVGLGQVQFKAGKTKEALKNFQQAIEKSREPGIYNDIAYILAVEEKELDLALEYAEAAVFRLEGDLRLLRSVKSWQRNIGTQNSMSAFLDTLGWVYFKKGDFEKARPYLEASAKLFPRAVVHEHLAWLYHKLGDEEKARDFGQKVRPLARAGQKINLPPGLDSNPEKGFAEPVTENEGRGEKITSTTVSSADPDFRKLLESSKNFRRPLVITGDPIRWPDGASLQGKDKEKVRVVCLVDAEGNILQFEAFTGSSPWKEAALEQIERIRFEPIQWGNPLIKLLRMVVFEYQSENVVTVYEPLMATMK